MKTLKYFYLSVFLLLMTSTINGQTNSISDDIIDKLSIEDENWKNEMNDLYDIINEPFNINTITKEQLERLGFLTPRQIEEILAYIYINGSLLSVKELLWIEEMDIDTYNKLLPFVCIIPKEQNDIFKWNKILKYGKNEIITNFQIPLYKKNAYKLPDKIHERDINKYYSGPSWSNSLRYSFHYSNHIYAGITASKDGGEPYFSKETKGYDYYSMYFLLKNIGSIKTLALGNYRLSYGLGLVMNNNFLLGKQGSIYSLSNMKESIRKHSSNDEYNYLSGGAVSYNISRYINGSIFYSKRYLDAIVKNDTITSIQTSGYHRTYKELERRKTCFQQLYGIRMEYAKNTFKIGTTVIYYTFNKPYYRRLQDYSTYYFRGKSNFNVSTDYHYYYKRFTFDGEAAYSKNNSCAFINVIRYNPLKPYSLVLLHRYYNKKYQAYFSRSFSEGNRIQNEHGLYLGMETSYFKKIKLSAYMDYFSFPFMKYGVDTSSRGFDSFFNLLYKPKKDLNMLFYYRFKEKGKNYKLEDNKEKAVIPYIQHKVRYKVNYIFNDNVTVYSMFNGNISYYQGYKNKTKGFEISTAITYKPISKPLIIDIQGGYFHTDDYNSRITVYEKSPLYSFCFPSYYGKGYHYMGMIRYDINKNLMATIKINRTIYLDRKYIGTGINKIEDKSKTDINILLRVKF